MPVEPPGLRAVAVAFFAATPEATANPKEARIRYGDLGTVLWAQGTLPSIDARILVANTSPLKLPRINVQVSIYLGRIAFASIPEPDAIAPGAPGIEETLFFERTYELDEMAAGSLGSVMVSGIQMQAAVDDLVRQKLWPCYLRVNATVSEPTGDVKVVAAQASSLLRIVPAPPRG